MKLTRFENNQIINYELHTLEEVEEFIEKSKREFREINKTDLILKSGGRDKAYERYCDELDELLKKFEKEQKEEKMDDYLTCKICPQSEHEGFACRCENRNIRVAKEMRKRGDRVWKDNSSHLDQHLAKPAGERLAE